MSNYESQQVSWWSVHEFVAAAIQQADISSWPMAGTPAWCALPDGDPRKWVALFVAGEHWSLRMETNQQLLADASKEVAGSADWSRVAFELRSLDSFRGTRPWAKRRAV
jgi:hypothetical protein